jgi:hypothetical protein
MVTPLALDRRRAGTRGNAPGSAIPARPAGAGKGLAERVRLYDSRPGGALPCHVRKLTQGLRSGKMHSGRLHLSAR